MSEDCRKCGTAMHELDDENLCPGCSNYEPESAMTNNKPNDVRVVPVELLERIVNLNNSFADHRQAKHDLVKFLAQPADQQGEPVGQWSDDDGISWCDGNESSLASARASGWLTRTLYRHAQPATAKVALPGLSDLREQYESWADANGYDITRNEHGDYAGIVEDSMWSGWQAKAEHWNIPDRIVIGQSIDLDTKAIGWNACLDEVAKLNGGQS